MFSVHRRTKSVHLLFQYLPCFIRKSTGKPLVATRRPHHNIQRIIDLACVFIVGGVRLNIGVLSFTGQLSAKYLLFIGKDIKLECDPIPFRTDSFLNVQILRDRKSVV